MAINLDNYTLKEILIKKVQAQTKFGEGMSVQPGSPINFNVGMGGGLVKTNNMQGIVIMNLKITPASDTPAFEFDIEAIAICESKIAFTETDLQEFAQNYAHKDIWPVIRQESQNILHSMGILVNLPITSPVKIQTTE